MKDYKRVPFIHMNNCRDLGGYACENGGFFRYHRLYRSDAPCQMSDAEWEQVLDMGVRTVIDLRSLSEQQHMPYEVPKQITRISVPLMREEIQLNNEASMQESALQAFSKSMEESYYKIVKESPQKLVSALKEVAQGLEKGAVLYHCSVGKDRTGILSAFIYLICGVDKMDIVADYQITETYLSQNPVIASLPDSIKGLTKSDPQTMKSFLEKIETEDLFGMLYDSGLTQKDIKIIQEKCVE